MVRKDIYAHYSRFNSTTLAAHISALEKTVKDLPPSFVTEAGLDMLLTILPEMWEAQVRLERNLWGKK